MCLAAAAALAVPHDSRAYSYTDMRIVSGLATTEATLTYHPDPCGTSYWHCDDANFPANAGLDMSNAIGSTSGSVFFDVYNSASGTYAVGVVQNHIHGGGTGSTCPGVEIHLWVPYPNPTTGTWIGWENYVQLNPTIAFGTNIYTATSGWSIANLGTLATSRPCAYWTAPHLHQDGGSGPGVYSNWPVDADDDASIGGVQINPTGNTATNFLHQIYY